MSSDMTKQEKLLKQIKQEKKKKERELKMSKTEDMKLKLAYKRIAKQQKSILELKTTNAKSKIKTIKRATNLIKKKIRLDYKTQKKKILENHREKLVEKIMDDKNLSDLEKKERATYILSLELSVVPDIIKNVHLLKNVELMSGVVPTNKLNMLRRKRQETQENYNKLKSDNKLIKKNPSPKEKGLVKFKDSLNKISQANMQKILIN